MSTHVIRLVFFPSSHKVSITRVRRFRREILGVRVYDRCNWENQGRVFGKHEGQVKAVNLT